MKILQPKTDGGAFLVVGGGLYQGEDEDSSDGGDDGQGDPEGAVLVRLQAPPPLVGPADDNANKGFSYSNLREVLLAVAVQDYIVVPFYPINQAPFLGQKRLGGVVSIFFITGSGGSGNGFRWSSGPKGYLRYSSLRKVYYSQ